MMDVDLNRGILRVEVLEEVQERFGSVIPHKEIVILEAEPSLRG